VTLEAYIHALWPELSLILAGMVCLFLGLLCPAGRRWIVASFALLVVAVVFALMTLLGSGAATSHAFEVASGVAVSSLSNYVRLLTLGVGALLILVNWYQSEETERGEYFSMVLFSMAGVMLVASSNDLILFFFALELVSIPTYVLVVMSRKDARAQEASSKYFFLGAMAAALTAYGLSFLYGVTGSTTFFGDSAQGVSIATKLASGGIASNYLLVGMVLVFGGLCFKIAAVPFHGYVADVYQGAAAPVSGLLAFLPKLAGFVGLIKLFSLMDWNLVPPLQWVVWIVAALTMTVGNVLALMQTNLKRLLGYSSIAHSGYMLIGLLVGPGDVAGGPMHNGLSAMLFYIAIYGMMNLGAFAVLTYLSSEEREAEDQEQLAGLSRREPLGALALTVCMFSLMGLPPTAGFLGKVYIFSSAFSASGESTLGQPMVWLAVIGVLNSAIGAAYYLRVVGVCYLRTGQEQLPPRPRIFLQLGTALCALLMILLFIWPRPFLSAAGKAISQLPSSAVGGFAVEVDENPQPAEALTQAQTLLP